MSLHEIAKNSFEKEKILEFLKKRYLGRIVSTLAHEIKIVDIEIFINNPADRFVMFWWHPSTKEPTISIGQIQDEVKNYLGLSTNWGRNWNEHLD